MKKYLVIYNTCEIRKNNLFLYIDGIDHLLNQKSNGFKYDLAVSGCRLHESTKIALFKRYGKKLIYFYTDALYPVNITFNKSVDEIVKVNGKYDGYVFVDSGVITIFDTVLEEIYNRDITNKYGIISVQTDTDTGYQSQFGLPHGYAFIGQDFIVPVGKCVNIHFNFYPHCFYEYYGRVLPDIFKASCTESVFYYMVSALKLKWCVIKDIVLKHHHSADGATSLEKYEPPTKPYWNELMCDIDITKAFADPRAKSTGFGYDEWAHTFDHNPAAFDSNGMPLDPNGLGDFLKETVLLSENLFDYNSIKFHLNI